MPKPLVGAVGAALASLLLTFGAAPAHADVVAAPSRHGAFVYELPEPPNSDEVRQELDALTVEQPHSMAGYSRDKFPHWVTINGRCDTRETVLRRDGADVTTDSECRAVSGS